MHRIKIRKKFEEKQVEYYLKEILKDIPIKNKKNTKQECYIVFENDEELDKIATSFSNILTERKLINYLYEYCFVQKMDEQKIAKFIEAFFLINPSFISYALIITKRKLISYLKFNDELDIEAFSLFNMSILKRDLDNLITDPFISESVYAISESEVMTMISTFKTVLELEELIKDIPKEEIKDFKIYRDNGLKCISETKVNIDEHYLKEKYRIELDSRMQDVEKMVILIGLIKPSRVIIFSSVSEEVKATLINSSKILGPALGNIRFFNASEPKPN